MSAACEGIVAPVIGFFQRGVVAQTPDQQPPVAPDDGRLLATDVLNEGAIGGGARLRWT